MSKPAKPYDQLVAQAMRCAQASHTSSPKQIEHWATIGKIAEESPDLPLRFVNDVFQGMQEAEAEGLSEYRFG